jgi:multidrug efflux system membrane fusion protein
MRFRFHTAAAIFVLIAAGAWVATGKYSFVGSAISNNDSQPAVAEAPTASTETKVAPVDALQTVAYAIAMPSAYERRIRLSGQTEADKQVVLVARTSGTIARLPVTEGDNLVQGGLVMAVDGAEKHAALQSARSQLESATLQADAYEKLNARGATPMLQFEASVAAREAARSAVEAAQAEVDKLEVHAPFAGIVDKVFVEVGSWVQPGDQVASVLALDPIVVVGEVNERDLQSVRKGTRTTVTFGDGTTAEGEVRYVRREASGQTHTFPIEVTIANPDAAIPAGMSAEIQLEVETAPVIVLPRSVVTLDTDGALGVRVLTGDGTVAFLKATIVDDTPDGLVLSGIAQGTRIIVSGQDIVSVGQKVAAVEAEGGLSAGRASN